jgi:hypothetical protein
VCVGLSNCCSEKNLWLDCCTDHVYAITPGHCV